MAVHLAGFLLGFTLAFGAFTFFKALKQTYVCWLRGTVNAYIIMIWLEWLSCMAVAVVSSMYLEKQIVPSFGYFFGMLCMWVVEVQCITQIIINRVSLIMFNPRRSLRLKWGVAILIGLINVSVFCIWIPAHLNPGSTIARVNEVWDRMEKCLFLVLELALNSYFMWLIHSELIANGLRKYNALFKVNVAMVVVSVSLDGIIIGVMSLPNGLIYIQFHSLFFSVKLHIEMTVAELIAKIAKTTAGSGNRTDLHREDPRNRCPSSQDGRREARFSCAISWQQCLGFDELSTPKHAIGEPLASHDEGRDGPDEEMGGLAESAAPPDASSRRESKVRERLNSAATTEVEWNGWEGRMDKNWIIEGCENCGCRGALTRRSEDPGYELKPLRCRRGSDWRRDSI